MGLSMIRHRNGSEMSDKALVKFQATGFSVDLPCVPKPNSESLNTPVGPMTVAQYLCVGGRDGYGVTATTVAPMQGATLDMTAAAKEAATEWGGTPTDVVSSTYQDHPAADFHVADGHRGSRKITVFMRIISTGSTLYEMQYLKAGNNIPTAPMNYPAFLASMHID
ncbi:MAG TPA: hypothetical protein VHV82_15295 [Sporichthyaceae bacterium]|jgi:hypothetical protein|nr:hypothetical protein [Sporichthyaceae bacterium]